MPISFFAQHRLTLLYGATLAALMFLLRWLELRFLILDHAVDVYIGGIAVLFTALGIWLARKLTSPKVETRVERVIVEKEVLVPAAAGFIRNENEIARLTLSSREMEVLEGMAMGLSNQEIAERLFVSLNTVKTHSQNLFEKLDVKRRTQAVEQARKLGIIP